jgi:hypothetical protein
VRSPEPGSAAIVVAASVMLFTSGGLASGA